MKLLVHANGFSWANGEFRESITIGRTPDGSSQKGPGSIRPNSTYTGLEIYDGTVWHPISGGGYRFYDQFIIGDGEIDAADTYQNEDFIGWEVHLYYDDKMLYKNITGRLSYDYDIETGTIVWTAALEADKPLRIYLSPPVVVPEPTELAIVDQTASPQYLEDESDSILLEVTVTGGTAPYTYKWFKGESLMATTETFTATEEGTYTCEVTDDNGDVGASDPIVVAIALQFSIAADSMDQYIDDDTAADATYDATYAIAPGDNLVATLDSTYANKYITFRFPASEPDPTSYYNTALNQGPIPTDGIFRPVFTVGSFKYLVSRDPLVLDVSQTLEIRH